MTDTTNKNAENLERILRTGEACHDSELRPFTEVSEALTREASAETAHLDATVARSQRETLLSMTSSSQKMSAPSQDPQKTPFDWKGLFQKRWFAIGGGFALVAAVLVVAIVFQSSRPSLPHVGGGAIAQLLIPEAHAADAFEVVPEKQDAAGIDVATSFDVSSNVNVDAKTLEQHLIVIPAISNDGSDPRPIAVTVQPQADKKFVVIPQAPLDASKVYKVKIDSAVQKSDGSFQQRDFSWAFQTKNNFRVISSVPGPNSSGVPLNTGIEFTMSIPDWEDPTPNFSITPKVDGRFETHGRSLAFVPNKPLAPATIYTVTIAHGWKVKNSDRALQKDVVLKFETSSDQPSMYQSVAPYVSLDTLLKTSPERDPEFLVYANDKGTKANINVSIYALGSDEAKSFLTSYLAIPTFAVESRKAISLFESYAKNKMMDAAVSITTENYNTILKLPQHLPAGRYVMKVQPQGGDASWSFIESTDVATYVMSDARQTKMWVMNIGTNRPLTDASVVSSKGTVNTDANGIATFDTPAALTSTSTDVTPEVVQVNQGPLSAFVILSQNAGGFIYNYGMNGQSSTDKTVSYLYVDRPLYHTTDKLEAFGIAQDRASKRGVGTVTLELLRGGYYDWYGDDPNANKVYRKVTLTTDDMGTFRGSMEWSTLAPGWYKLSLKRDGVEVTSRTFEIKDFVKPAYTIDVSTQKTDVYGGEDVTGEVHAAFFDGTPLPNTPMTLTATGKNGQQLDQQHLTTDADGRATFVVHTPVDTCDLTNTNGDCLSSTNLAISVVPSQGEETDIRAEADVNMWRTRIQLDATATTKDAAKTIDVSINANHLDLTRTYDTQNHSVIGEPLRNAQISGRVIKHTWIATQNGTYYDPISKLVSPKYRYSEQNTDVGTFALTTDSSGKAMTTVTPPADADPYASYRVEVTSVDEKGVIAATTAWVYPDWTSRGYPYMDDSNSRPNFHVISPMNISQYPLDKPVTVGFTRSNNEVVPKSDASRFLYVTSHLGIRTVDVSDSPTREIRMTDADVPNMRVTGVMFVNGGFFDGDAYLTFDSQQRNITMTLTPNQSTYAPGATATVHIKAKRADGQVAAGARVALGAVDEALYAVAQTTGQEDPLSSLYSWVPDGIIFQQSSIAPVGVASFAGGGAEMGGGGGGDAIPIRKNFKDTAAFETATLDANGEGDITMTLPDNLTTWRVTGVALTSDLFAGSTQTELNVSKRVFVDAVVPSPLLTTDKPVIKLRAFGTGLKPDTDVTYTVDSPTLGLNHETVSAKANTPVYVAVASLPEGDHTLTITLSSKDGTDGLEKHLVVVSSRFTRDELTQTELGPGTTLPDPGQSREVDVQFLPKTRAQYLGDVLSLTWGFSQRVETQIANRIAARILQTQYGRTDVETPSASLSSYQQADGGIAPLPYGSSDVELSSKIAAIAPEYFDKNALSDYLTKMTQDKDVTREQVIRAYSGLAALGQPVLLQLQALSKQTDLTWHEKLGLIRGLDAAGDREAARGLLTSLLKTGDEHDGKISLNVSNDMKDIMEATSEAAGLAAVIGDDSAPKLYAWVKSNWVADALTDLDRAALLQRLIPLASTNDVSISYVVNGETKSTGIKNSYGERITLTPDEVKSFRVVSVNGPAVAVMVRSVPGIPASNKDLSIQRTYSREDGKSMDDLKEGDEVVVTLFVKLTSMAPNVCYTVKDLLPAGMLPETSGFENNAYSYVYCSFSTDPVMSYRTRVMSRGTYHAEPAIIQSMDSPSIEAVSDSSTITVK